MFKLCNINKTYKDKIALTIDELSLITNGIIYINGESGAGKTTLINCLAGLDKFDSGDIFINEEKVDSLKEYSSIIYQDFQLFDNLSVYKNLQLACDMFKTDYKEIDSLLEKFNITDIKDNLAYNISAGQKQRVAIARALLTNKQIIFCDEPFANIDKNNKEEILNLIRQESKDKLFIIITHEKLSKKYFDQHITIDNGKIIQNTITKDNSNNKLSKSTPKLSFKNMFNLLIAFSKKHRGFAFFSILMVLAMTIMSICSNVLITDAAQQTYSVFKENNVTAINFAIPNKMNAAYPYKSYFFNNELKPHQYKTITTDSLISASGMKNERLIIEQIYTSNLEFYELENSSALKLNDNEIIVSSDYAEKLTEGSINNLINYEIQIANNKYIIKDIFKKRTSLNMTIGCNQNALQTIQTNYWSYANNYNLSVTYNTTPNNNDGFTYLIKNDDDNIEMLYGQKPQGSDEILINDNLAKKLFNQNLSEELLNKDVAITFKTTSFYIDCISETKTYKIKGLFKLTKNNFGPQSFLFAFNNSEQEEIANAYHKESLNNMLNGLGFIGFTFKDIKNAYDLGLESNSELAIVTYSINSFTHSWQVFFFSITGIFVFIAIVLLYTSLKTSININKKNLGILLSQGVSKTKSSLIIFLETAIYNIASFIISIPLGVGLLYGFNKLLKINFKINFTICLYSLWTPLIILSGSIITLVISWIINYYKMKKLSVIEIIYDK